jgi:hypothetical protein
VFKDKDVIGLPIFYRLLYMWFTALMARVAYYVAWTLADLVCNASGLGFNGHDLKTGKPMWNLSTNVDVLGFEVRLTFFEDIL